MTPAGLEPAVPGPVGQCHIQLATNLLGLVRFQLSAQLGADRGPQVGRTVRRWCGGVFRRGNPGLMGSGWLPATRVGAASPGLCNETLRGKVCIML